MAFHEVRFPDNISRGARGGPERRTQIVELASGDEERNASWANSRRRYDVAYGIRRADDLAAVVAFFEARNGRLHGRQIPIGLGDELLKAAGAAEHLRGPGMLDAVRRILGHHHATDRIAHRPILVRAARAVRAVVMPPLAGGQCCRLCLPRRQGDEVCACSLPA